MGASPTAARGGRSALRALQHRLRAVQVPRRVGAHHVSTTRSLGEKGEGGRGKLGGEVGRVEEDGDVRGGDCGSATSGYQSPTLLPPTSYLLPPTSYLLPPTSYLPTLPFPL